MMIFSFDFPVRSSESNIYELDGKKLRSNMFSLNDIFCMMVQVCYDNSKAVFIPVTHTIKGKKL